MKQKKEVYVKSQFPEDKFVEPVWPIFQPSSHALSVGFWVDRSRERGWPMLGTTIWLLCRHLKMLDALRNNRTLL